MKNSYRAFRLQSVTVTSPSTAFAAKNQHALARGIRAYHDRLALTTEEVAAAVDMSPDHLRKILRGKAHVTLTDLHRIADAIDSRIVATIKVGKAPTDRDETQPG